MISFDQAYRILQAKGPAQITSRKGTEYTVYAHIISKNEREGELSIRAVVLNKKGLEQYIYVHADCWGAKETCQRTRAGGLYDTNLAIEVLKE
jgi:hypothetical protein